MKIKQLKIINQDQSTEIADIGADAINIDYNDTTVKAELDKLDNDNSVNKSSITNLQGELNTTNSNLSLQTSRIDNLAHLDEGSTTGDAELIDIRTGYDGTNYSTAGEAVRKQVNNINRELSPLTTLYLGQDGNLFNKNKIIENEYIDSTGEIKKSNTWVRTDFIPINEGELYLRYGPMTIAWYDENKQWLHTSLTDSSSQWGTSRPSTGWKYAIISTYKTNWETCFFSSNNLIDKNNPPASYYSLESCNFSNKSINREKINIFDENSSVNKFNLEKFHATAQYYDGDTLTNYDYYGYTDLIEIKANTTYYTDKGIFCSYYDANKNYLSKYATGNVSPINKRRIRFTTPANTEYVRFSVDYRVVNDIHIWEASDLIKEDDNYRPDFDYNKINIRELNDKLDKHDFYDYTIKQTLTTDVDFSECTNHVWGGTSPANMHLYTNGFIASNYIRLRGLSLSGRFSQNTKVCIYVSYENYYQNKRWKFRYDDVDINKIEDLNIIVAPKEQIWLGLYNADLYYSNNDDSVSNLALSTIDAEPMYVKYFIAYNIEYDVLDSSYEIKNYKGLFPRVEALEQAVVPIKRDLKICCIGDSLTQGIDYRSHTIAENYPYFMSQWLSDENNVTILNWGKSGMSSKSWWNNLASYGYQFDSSIDIVLIMFGTNGGLATNTLATDVEPYDNWEDYADTSVGDYCKLIEFIMQETSNHAQIFLLPPPYSTYTTAQENLCINSNPVVKAIAKRYSLPVIDVLYESGMGKFNGDYFRPHDGCHFNAKGYHRLGTFIGSRIKSYLSTFNLNDVYPDETQDE